MNSDEKEDDAMQRERHLKKGFRIAAHVVLGVFAAGLFALAFGVLVMVLWNWLMPPLFGLPAVTYWQAFGLIILAKLIFGAFGGFGGRRHAWNGHGREWHPPHGWEKEKWGPGMWRHYRNFWKEDGKRAFEEFIKHAERERTPGKASPVYPNEEK